MQINAYKDKLILLKKGHEKILLQLPVINGREVDGQNL